MLNFILFNALTSSTEVQTSNTAYEQIRVADIKSLGVMKLEVMSRRNLFRDYYDVYSFCMKDITERSGQMCGIYHAIG